MKTLNPQSTLADDTIRRILAAVDFSEHSLPIVQTAAYLARHLEAGLVLVNVINQRDVDMLKKVADQAPEFSLKTYLEALRQERVLIVSISGSANDL